MKIDLPNHGFARLFQSAVVGARFFTSLVKKVCRVPLRRYLTRVSYDVHKPMEINMTAPITITLRRTFLRQATALDMPEPIKGTKDSATFELTEEQLTNLRRITAPMTATELPEDKLAAANIRRAAEGALRAIEEVEAGRKKITPVEHSTKAIYDTPHAAFEHFNKELFDVSAKAFLARNNVDKPLFSKRAVKAKRQDVSKVKHACPSCKTNIWGKEGIFVVCGDCGVQMTPVLYI